MTIKTLLMWYEGRGTALMLPLLALQIGVSSCNQQSTHETEKDSDTLMTMNVEKTEKGTDTDAVETITVEEKIFNTFSVNGHTVHIPHLIDLEPLTKKFSKSDNIKKITFYSLTPSGGLEYMAEFEPKFTNARNLNDAKKYSYPILKFDFDKKGNVIKIEYDPGESALLTYDDSNHIVKIKTSSEGYRGDASYSEDYTFAWESDNPISMKRKFIEYEAGFNDEPAEKAVPIQYDFRYFNMEEILQSVRKSNLSLYGNSCRIYNPEMNLPIWCEIEYFHDK